MPELKSFFADVQTGLNLANNVVINIPHSTFCRREAIISELSKKKRDRRPKDQLPRSS